MVAFHDAPVRVRVPATSANLGPGFDTLGLALALHDELTARVSASLDVEVRGEDASAVPRTERHLVVTAMRAAFDRMGGRPPGVELTTSNHIPHGRGLGSSAGAIVAGVLLARALVVHGDQLLDDVAALALASELEGHPDNVAPCLLGGLTVAWTDEVGARAVRLEPAASVRPVVFVPQRHASTAEARRLLPAQVPHGDAVFNAARSALLVAALTGATDALFDATGDRLHQRYRGAAMPESLALIEQLRAAGLPAVLSGAGPTVLVLARDDAEAARAGEQAPLDWRVAELAVDRGGAVVA
ncbi:MAG: homoserine kinase [Actinomycetia bacterium]|nr:homoserine kinase [Actinomycetes bacterium]